ncbi:MAG: GTP cyclohydrolase I [Deltaproteobacteria bacterium]
MRSSTAASRRRLARPGPGQTSGIDQGRLAEAVRGFLAAAGRPLEGELLGTPERVAEAWATDFLDGYATSPKDALGPLLAAGPDTGLVCVTGLDFHSICPHHLLPYRGLAHVAFLPNRHLVGFSRLGKLVDALGHRLVLQETLAAEVARELWRGTLAKGAACILEAEQACLSCRGRHRRRARTTTDSFVGVFAAQAEWRERLLRAIAAGAKPWPRSLAP